MQISLVCHHVTGRIIYSNISCPEAFLGKYLTAVKKNTSTHTNSVGGDRERSYGQLNTSTTRCRQCCFLSLLLNLNTGIHASGA
ncbi:unnamed protein product [Arctogadus glacialis]